MKKKISLKIWKKNPEIRHLLTNHQQGYFGFRFASLVVNVFDPHFIFEFNGTLLGLLSAENVVHMLNTSLYF